MTAELLVLVTQSYPFGAYVDFLEEEIEYLAGEFGWVLIARLVANDGGWSCPTTGEVCAELDGQLGLRV